MTIQTHFKKFRELYNIKNLPEEKLIQLAACVLQENNKVNITAARSVEQIIQEHILDSLTLLSLVNISKNNWADIGSGGGFPALPLAICLPNFQFTLIESIGKKCTAMKNICDALEISNCTILNSRAEDIGQDQKFRETFDYVSARAVGSFAVQSELTLPLLKINGTLLLQKSLDEKINPEILNQQLEPLGGKLNQIQPVAQTTATPKKRVIYYIIKNKATHEKYPRRAGVPAKRPLWKE